jgi:hypothetical protein
LRCRGPRIAGYEDREPVNCVGKDPPHRLGEPYT